MRINETIKTTRIIEFIRNYKCDIVPADQIAIYMGTDAIMVEPILSALCHIGTIEVTERDSSGSIKTIKLR